MLPPRNRILPLANEHSLEVVMGTVLPIDLVYERSPGERDAYRRIRLFLWSWDNANIDRRTLH